METSTGTQVNLAERNRLALVITNAYRARNNMPALVHHASVDEDIADAILAAGWSHDGTTPEKDSAGDSLAILDEVVRHGLGSRKSPRAFQVRELALTFMKEHSQYVDRSTYEHVLRCSADEHAWPCPEHETARAAFLYAGGDESEI